MTSIKWNGREVKNQPARVVVAVVIVIWCLILLPIGMVILIIGLVVAAPFHPIFRVFGRKGVFQGNGIIAFDKTSFKHR